MADRAQAAMIRQCLRTAPAVQRHFEHFELDARSESRVAAAFLDDLTLWLRDCGYVALKTRPDPVVEASLPETVGLG